MRESLIPEHTLNDLAVLWDYIDLPARLEFVDNLAVSVYGDPRQWTRVVNEIAAKRKENAAKLQDGKIPQGEDVSDLRPSDPQAEASL